MLTLLLLVEGDSGYGLWVRLQSSPMALPACRAAHAEVGNREIPIQPSHHLMPNQHSGRSHVPDHAYVSRPKAASCYDDISWYRETYTYRCCERFLTAARIQPRVAMGLRKGCIRPSPEDCLGLTKRIADALGPIEHGQPHAATEEASGAVSWQVKRIAGAIG